MNVCAAIRHPPFGTTTGEREMSQTWHVSNREHVAVLRPSDEDGQDPLRATACVNGV